MKIFIFAGQSNAQGYGSRIQLNPVPGWAQTEANGWMGAPTLSSDTGIQYQHPTLANFPMLYVMSNTGLVGTVVDAWGQYQGSNPNGSGGESEDSGYGPELSFLRKYQNDHPGEQLAAIKCVLGGSSLESDWMPPDKNMWNVLSLMISQAKTRLQNASISYEWAGFIWMQGESGATGTYGYVHGYTPGEEYSDHLRTFLAAVRGLASSSMPCIIGRISNSMEADRIIDPLVTGGDNTKLNLIGAVEHRRAQQVLVGGDPNNTWWDNDNLPVLIDTVHPEWSYHFQSSGYLAMGERAYTAYAALTEPNGGTTMSGSFTMQGSWQ